MDFLDRLYSSNYFGIGLFAVIAFLVVTFLIVLFFGKKDEKKRKLESTQKMSTENTFKETSTATQVEIPTNPEPVAPINLEPPVQETPVVAPTVEPVAEASIATPVTPVMPVPPVTPIHVESNNDYVDNLTVEEPVAQPVIDTPKVEPIIPTVTPVVNNEPKMESPRVELEPTKIEVPKEPVQPIVEPVTRFSSEPVRPVIEENEPKLQINDEPIVNTYYKPVEKTEAEAIKVPNIDFDALAKSISKELDELENDSKRYEDVKVTPINEVTRPTPVRQPETFSSVYVREEPKATSSINEGIELPKRIDLPARKSE